MNQEPRPAKTVAESRTEQVQILLPEHINGYNRLFGGQLMQWIDIVAAVAAGLYSDGVVQIDADEAFESFADQAQQFSDDVEDLLDDAFFDNLPEFVR